MKKCALALTLLPLASAPASAEVTDVSAYLAPSQTHLGYTLEVDTDAGGFHLHHPHHPEFIAFGASGFKVAPSTQGAARYTRDGGKFKLILDAQGHPLSVDPMLPTLGGGEGAAGCANVERECNKDANDRYDKALEKCESKFGDKDRAECKAEARAERERYESKCEKNTDRCYRSSEIESRGGSGDSISGGISAGESMFSRFTNWMHGD